jgi:hypothetical protein
VIVKALAPNDNSKNQLFLGGDFADTAIIPSGNPVLASARSRDAPSGTSIIHAPINLYWLGVNSAEPAMHAQLIYYPQYPEVRLSGLLKGVKSAPTDLLSPARRGREEGRILLLGINDAERSVFAVLLSAKARSAEYIRITIRLAGNGILTVWQLEADASPSERELLVELCRIHKKKWIPGKRLTSQGVVGYSASNGGGYTLEAELGVRANGYSNPDFMGWEVKQHGVGSFSRPTASRITLFTPEPDGGVYADHGVAEFANRWGRENQRKRRFDFAGTHVFGRRLERTGLTLQLEGYSEHSPSFLSNGRIVLLDENETVAASWSYSKLLGHWKRKHSQAVYVPSVARNNLGSFGSRREYQFGSSVKLCVGTQFSRFLHAVSRGLIVYDPGVHVRNDGSSKRRNQFRINSLHLAELYEQVKDVEACPACS